jgi:HEAT repeat protein
MTPKRTGRICICCWAALAALLLLAVFCRPAADPLPRARRAVDAVEAGCRPPGKPRRWSEALVSKQIEELGGPVEASRILERYIGAPAILAKHKPVAMAMLERCGDPALPVFRRALGNADPEMRRHAAQFLRGRPGAAAPAQAALLRLLDDKDRRVAFHAASALVGIGPAALPGLMDRLRNGSPRAQEFALSALTDRRLHRALARQQGLRELLLKFTRSRQQSSRDTAYWLLVCTDPLFLKKQPLIVLSLPGLPRLQRISASAAEVAAEVTPPSSDYFTEALALYLQLPDRPREIRLAAVRALGRRGRAGVNALQKAGEDSDPEIRQAAAKTLETVGDWMPSEGLPFMQDGHP